MPKPAEPSLVIRFLFAGMILTLLGLWLVYMPAEGPALQRIPYSELLADVNDGRVERAEIGPDRIRSTLRAEANKPAVVVITDRVPNLEERNLLEALEKKGAVISGAPEHSSGWTVALWTLVPLALLGALLWAFSRMANPGRRRPLTFGRSKARLYDRSQEHPVTFADVAGVDEAKEELQEIIRFLKEPEKYRAMGARVPKGVLLVGAPGTGKTLLAKAVAGESGVPFFSMSGSEFVEMFVGVGASRVRDLFEQAKERAPCIVFIDELDAVGKSRAGGAGMVSNEEREQTLNQLLVEMDGFDSGSGLVIMSATNRPEILDRALLRAGRFDRQVLVDRPDIRGRAAILGVHARKVRLGVDVDIDVVAHRTPGMVGADLANVVNEAALASVRRGGAHVDEQDFEEAIDRIQLGLRKEGRVMTDEEKRRVAIHEAGHALVALSMAHADPVHRVTILPRSIGALGATLQLPTTDRYLLTREELRDRICVLLGGRAAEELVCADISTGAQDDLEHASEMARQMVCRYGMSDALGALTFGHDGDGQFLPGHQDAAASRNFSEETARVIDVEIKTIVEAEHLRAAAELEKRRAALDAITRELLKRETLQGADLAAVVAGCRQAMPVQPS